MPLQVAPKQIASQEITRFLGLDLRSDPDSGGNGALVKSINADLHSTPGAIKLGGKSRVRISGLGGRVSQTERFGNRLISLRDNLVYDNGSLAVTATSLDITSYTSLVGYQGLGDSVTQVYLANKGKMFRLPAGGGNFALPWGISRPGSAPIVSSRTEGPLIGTYSFVYTYVRKDGVSIASESNPSEPTVVHALFNPTGSTINLDVIGISLEQASHIRIYRTQDGGSVHLFDTEVLNTTQTVEITKADFLLGGAVSAFHTPPPTADLAVVHNDRVFVADSETNRLHYSQKFQPEYFDSFIDIGPTYDSIQGLVSIGGVLGVFTQETKYAVIEHLSGVEAIGGGIPFIGAATSGFTPVEAASRRGCRSPGAIVNTGSGVIFPAPDGVFLTDFRGPDQAISGPIEERFTQTEDLSLFPYDITEAQKARAEFYKGRYYLSYQAKGRAEADRTLVYSTQTGQWYTYHQESTMLSYDEREDRLLRGDSQGNIYTLETGLEDGNVGIVSAEVRTFALHGGNRYSKKLFLYARIDADVATGDTLAVDLLVDDVVKTTFAITGARTRGLLRVPSGVRGHTWALEFRLSGRGQSTVYGGMVSWMPLEIS